MARVTVLGSAGSFPSAGRACSSYLVEHDGHRIVLDCGNGSMGNVQRVADVAQIDAVVISHLHPDHSVDLDGLYVALTLHPSGPQSVEIHAAAGAEEHIARLMPDEPFREHCRFHVASAGSTVGIGQMDITFFAADHPVETLASRIDAGGSVIAYTTDTAPSATSALLSVQLTCCYTRPAGLRPTVRILPASTSPVPMLDGWPPKPTSTIWC